MIFFPRISSSKNGEGKGTFPVYRTKQLCQRQITYGGVDIL